LATRHPAVASTNMSKGRRTCVFCGDRADSVEHIFKKDFKKKLDITDYPREYTHTDVRTGVVTTRQDPLFEAKVKRVCRKCNSGWMNRLDLAVERWIVDPADENAYHDCDPKTFRRWAIKLALMRSLLNSATVVPREYFLRLFNGDDLDEWHVFVGRSDFKEWRHNFTNVGIAADRTDGSMGYGILHASWVLGEVVVSAVCIPGGDPETHFFPAFRTYNLNVGEPLVEVPYGAADLPDVFSRRKLLFGQALPFFRFFTPESESPVAREMKKTYDLITSVNEGTYDPGVA
jgi:hypothetical protein